MTIALLVSLCGLLGPAIPLGAGLEVMGQPMRLSLLYSAEPAERITGRCARELAARGLLPLASGNHVAVFDPKDGRELFVGAVAQGGDRTLVIVGSADPRNPPVPSTAPSGFPLPTGSRAFLGYRSDDGGAHAESGQFVTSQSPEEIAAFYRAALGAEGFHESGSTPGFLRFARAGTSLLIGVQGLGERSGAAVFVSRWEEAR